MRGGDRLFEVEPVDKQQPQGPSGEGGQAVQGVRLAPGPATAPSLDEWLPQNHLARFVADLADEVLGSRQCRRTTPRSAAARPTNRS
ncbi:hypothetical protein ACVWXU_001514 [Streptomyces sp. TE33382]